MQPVSLERGEAMQRNISRIIFFFWALLASTVAYTVPRDFSLEEKKQNFSRENPCHSAVETDRFLSRAFETASEPSGREVASTDKRMDKKEEVARPVNRSQTETPECGCPDSTETLSPTPPPADAVHFLLIGRRPQSPLAAILMVVTLVPENYAHLTAINPASRVPFKGQLCPIGELLARGANHDRLNRAAAELSGLEPQFYIDLNLDGFVKMINLLDREEHNPAGTAASRHAHPAGGSGKDVLSFLCDYQVQGAEKEKLLIDYLLKACNIRATSSGLKLLWIGYHHLKTDLSLSDLIQIRTVSEKISPQEISLTVIDH